MEKRKLLKELNFLLHDHIVLLSQYPIEALLGHGSKITITLADYCSCSIRLCNQCNLSERITRTQCFQLYEILIHNA